MKLNLCILLIKHFQHYGGALFGGVIISMKPAYLSNISNIG